jgi:Family of unknown function (DUF5946)
MLASPGCWAAYTEMTSDPTATLEVSPSVAALMVDAYAVQHPGVPNPQATQSVWVHLMTLHLAIDAGWPATQLVRLRRFGADTSDGLEWLEPPGSMGPVTAIDVVRADPSSRAEVAASWVHGAWAAWATHHSAIRARADRLVARLD